MMTNLSSAISQSTSKLKTSANKAVKSFSTALSNKASTLKSSGTKMSTNVNSGLNSSDAVSGRTKACNAVVDGFVKSLTSASNMTKMYNAGKKLAQRKNKGFTDTDKTQSPSKLYMQFANYNIQGYIKGVKKYGNLAYSAGETLATGISSAFSTALDLSDSILENGVEPTITPVLDFSDVRYGMGQINSMFGSRQLALAGNINGTIQNGSDSLESTVSDLSSRLNKLTDTMNSRQMINYITVDGSSDPEVFADKLVRKLKINMRSM